MSVLYGRLASNNNTLGGPMAHSAGTFERYNTISSGAPTDPNFANVSLLLHLDGVNGATTTSDSSSNNVSVTMVSPTAISTSQFKFGGSSAVNVATTGAITAANSALFNFGTSDFTIELWFYQTSSNTMFVFDFREFSYSTGLCVYLESTSIKVFKEADVIIGTRPSQNGWHHCAVCRVSGVTRLFVDGVQTGSNFVDSTNYSGDIPRFGKAGHFDGSGFVGYLDEIRVTKGVGRYSANFTAPTAPFPNS